MQSLVNTKQHLGLAQTLTQPYLLRNESSHIKIQLFRHECIIYTILF